MRSSTIRNALGKALRTLWPPPPTAPPMPAGVSVYDLNGVKVMLDSANLNHRSMYLNQTFEPEMTSALHSVFRANDVFLDIGANVGWHSLSLLVRRPEVSMAYAFEPSSRTYEMLLEGIKANGCADRCEARRMALSDKKGVAKFKTFPELGSLHSSLYPLGDLPFVEEEVELDTLDSQVRSFIGPPAVIKCDVEGAEMDILKGATDTLSGKHAPPPIWFLEANYETSAMAGFFPWQMIDFVRSYAPYEGYFVRDGRVKPLPDQRALRHGDTLVLGVPEFHDERFKD